MARGGEIWQTGGKKEKESQTMNQIQANIRVLSDGEIVRIHNTSMRILSEIGLHVPNETVCGMAQKLGVKVDGETVRIPAEALDPILALARAQAIIAENRTDEPVIDGALCAMLDKIVQDALDHLDA
ncbi:trimethylamine methyltransferase family protein [Butyricicoccus pullicaecorum]|uniref:trimethylamine methyltransferase family protein n=1 Tax=Butyricicoccus pullicaecorum TaxID=501571 RepID=UPI00351F8B83